MNTSIQRLPKMKKFIFWINAYPPVEKRSNQDWNSLIHLKNKGPHTKVPLIFWFLTMTFNLRFYPLFWVTWVCIHIRNSFGRIRQTHAQLPKSLCTFDTEWNAHQIGILDNLFDSRQLQQHVINTSTWSKKIVLYIVHLIILCTWTETSIYW